MNQPFEFRVWDKSNGIFLTELQTDFGEWCWGRDKHDPGKSSWHWVFDHPEDFVVTVYIGIQGSDKKKIFSGDIVVCWDHDDSEYSNKTEGVIEYMGNCFALKCKRRKDGQIVYLRDWNNAENIQVTGNIFEHSAKAKMLAE